MASKTLAIYFVDGTAPLSTNTAKYPDLQSVIDKIDEGDDVVRFTVPGEYANTYLHHTIKTDKIVRYIVTEDNRQSPSRYLGQEEAPAKMVGALLFYGKIGLSI